MENIKIIAPLPSISKRTRLTKIAKSIANTYDIRFFGWQRLNIEAQKKDKYQTKILIRGGGYSSKKARLMYILWMTKVFITSFNFDKGDIVWALGFESAFPAVLVSKFKGFKVIYDDADRFSSLFNFPNPLRKALVNLEVYTSHNCFKHVIPGKERYEFDSPNFFILKNTPTTKDIQKSKEVELNEEVLELLAQYDSVIYVNGWLGDGRGLKIIYEVAKSLPNNAFLLAGRIDSCFASDMLNFENVIYLGELPQFEALAYYQVSNLVFTYYDPAIPINRKAEANKWGDALQFSIPIIVNSEVETASYLHEAGCAISVPYNDIEKLKQEIIFHSKASDQYLQMVSSVKRLKTKFKPFDLQLKDLFNNME